MAITKIMEDAQMDDLFPENPRNILVKFASKDAVDGFVHWRKITKKPLTDRAAGMIAKTLRDITGSGGDADEALDLAQEHGWQTIKADWYWRIKNGNKVNGTHSARDTIADTADRQRAFARAACRTPGRDLF